MKEITLRRSHRYLGIILAVFLLLQGGSGLLLSATELFAPGIGANPQAVHTHAGEVFSEPGTAASGAEPPVGRHGRLGKLHHSQGTLWNLYRIVVGAGLMALLVSGTAIFLMTRARTPDKPRL